MEMEAAAVVVSAPTGALKPVLQKLAALLGDDAYYKRRLRGAVREEIKSLTDDLTAMHASLLRMSEEEEDPDVQDKAWVTVVRELSYDMEDSIDDFMQRIDDDKADGAKAQDEGFMEKMRNSLGKMKARRLIGTEIHDYLKKQIMEVGETNASRYNKTSTHDDDTYVDSKKQIIEVDERNAARYKAHEAFSHTNHATVDPRAIAIFDHASKLIDEPRAELVKLLVEEDGCASSTRQQVEVVSIVGAGGKALANQVYQELRVQFECTAFVSMSSDPDMMNILTAILSQVSDGQDYANSQAAGSVQQLIVDINDFLLDKSYFIVVDYIWRKETWDVIKDAFPMTSCGRIMTTSHVNDVADSCQSSSFNDHIYNIRPLDKVQSRQLFYRKPFNSEEDCPSHVEEVFDQILEKCAGFPLTIIAISGLLANTERTEHQWNQVKESIGCAHERSDGVERMKKILSLCYFDLLPRVKTCLLYLGIFPKGYIIEMNDLTRRWIAEGFIHREGSKCRAHELGERCFNELINRSLIQPVKTDQNGKVKSCRVDDTIIDFIISKSIEENFVTLVGVHAKPTSESSTENKVARRLSLQGYDGEEEENSSVLQTKTQLVLSHARSLSVFALSGEIPCLDEMKHLRVVSFEALSQLQDHHLENIGRLLQLRYLNLKGTGICNLPEEIGHLCCLEMLDIRVTGVTQLPSSIVNLGKSVHLFVGGFVDFPSDGIGKMQALETLKQVSAFKQPLGFLQDFGQLQNLRKLNINLEGDPKEECMKAVASSLRELGTHKQLRSLTIWNHRCGLLMEPWCLAPVSLRKLTTWDSTFPRVPYWMGSLINLQHLQIEVEGVRQEDLCILGGLPALLNLTLIGKEMSKGGKLVVSGGMGLFPCLRRFCYSMSRGLGMEMMFAAGSMPNIEKLEVCFSPTMKYISTSSSSASVGGGAAAAFDFGIENLSCLTTIVCSCEAYSNDESSIEAAKVAMERAASTHPNHPALDFVIY